MKRFIVLIIIVLGFNFINVISEDNAPVKLPTKSVPNKLLLTSNGCCFWVENVDVSLQSNSAEHVVISHNEGIYMDDIFKYPIPDFSESPVQLVVKFRSFYADECDFSMPVMEFENIYDLKKTGVLLYFQEHDDMYLNVIAGDYHASYKMGSSENRWSIMETPNKIYSRKKNNISASVLEGFFYLPIIM